MRRISCIMISALLAAWLATTADLYADSNNDATQDDEPKPQLLAGLPGGARAQLSNKGIEFNPTDTFDLFGNTTGGIKKGIKPLNQLDFNTVLDGSKLMGVSGLTANISIVDNTGSPNRSLIGSAQRIDNAETYRSGVSIYQAWLQQNWKQNTFSALAGIYDFSTEFYALDSSDFFLNTGFELGPELADTTRDGSLVFPASLPTLRLRYQPVQQWYAQALIADGVNSQALDNYSSNHHGDTVPTIVMGEIGFLPQNGKKQLGKFAIGVWRTRQNSSFTMTPYVDRDNGGVYFISQYALYQPKDTEDKGLKGFLRIGYADAGDEHFNYSFSTGLVYTGVIPGREKSQLGLAFSNAHTDSNYNRQLALAGETIAQGEEKLLELSYKDYFLPWLSAQPDMQYIISPDDATARGNAFVIGARVEANF